MNKYLSLLFCLSLMLPVHAMDIHLVEDQTPAPKLTDRIWKAISCNKVLATSVFIAALSILSTGGYFITTTCFDMKGVCTQMQGGCDTIQEGCTEMKSACNNCTTDFAQANCGLKLVDSVAQLIEQIVKKYPQVALDLALELGNLNKTFACH